jgi:hypothetical protein
MLRALAVPPFKLSPTLLRLLLVALLLRSARPANERSRTVPLFPFFFFVNTLFMLFTKTC